mgnify:CR=1 FL=1
MPLQRAAIALGSNLGDCHATVNGALEALHRSPGIRVLARSSWYRSAPVGPPQPDYLNGCAVLAVGLQAEALLDQLQAIEHAFGRVRAERWGPRSLDLDLIFLDDQILDTPHLQLPHPRLRERAFVLMPLAEIAPDWPDPITGLTVAELAARVAASGELVRLPEPD